MEKEYDFSKAKRAKDVPHLAKLQAEARGKTRVTIMLDNDVIAGFRARAHAAGTGYQTEINRTLRHYLADDSGPLTLESVRRVIREEVQSR